MKIPNVLSSAVIAGAIALLQYLLGHVDAFNLPSLYAPIAVVVLTTLIKMVTESQQPELQVAARGLGEEKQHGYLTRVLIK